MYVGMIPVRVLFAIVANKKLISNGRQFIQTPTRQFLPNALTRTILPTNVKLTCIKQ